MKTIVVGTGIVGASAAYYLVKQGIEVVMVDRPEEGKQPLQVLALFVLGFLMWKTRIGMQLQREGRYITLN